MKKSSRGIRREAFETGIEDRARERRESARESPGRESTIGESTIGESTIGDAAIGKSATREAAAMRESAIREASESSVIDTARDSRAGAHQRGDFEAAPAPVEGAPPSVSVLIPVSERSSSLVDLYQEYSAPLAEGGRSFEFVFLAEPWFRDDLAPLKLLAFEGAPIRVFEAGHSVGEAALLKLGAECSEAPVIVTLPAYHRVEASALPRLVQRVEQGADLAVARRWPRRDSWINRTQGSVFHWLTGGFARKRLHDLGCGVRAMRREIFQEIPIYGDFFRFLPILALREGFQVEEFPAAQHPGDVRTRLYSPGTYLRRLIDLLGLFFLLRFTEKPLRFFGLVGSLSSIAGGLILGFMVVERMQGQPLADRPLLLLGVLLVALGAQAIALGLVGEIIVHLHAPEHRSYRIARERKR